MSKSHNQNHMKGSVKNPFKTIRTVFKRHKRITYISYKRKPQA